MTERTMEPDDKRWLDWARGDVQRTLLERGWDREEVSKLDAAMPDEAFQIIRANAVQEVAEHFIVGMRSTARIRELLAYATSLRPMATERSDEAFRRRNAALAALSHRPLPQPKEMHR